MKIGGGYLQNFMETREAFRDSMATIDEEGKRLWIFPKKPFGRYYNARNWVTIVLLAILFAGPFIKIGGQPLLLLNFFERKFVIFGKIFWPQDTHLLIFLLLIFFVFIILFTVAFGRVWCGWACPQTLFMEMVFRKIEYWIEGDANQQRKLAAMPWNGQKVWKRGFKYLIFLAISLLISHTVMAYLIGWEKTVEIVSQSPSEHLSGFIGLIAFTGIFMFVFAYFREQACTIVCPYGRLQGVLLDNSSIVVIYDWLRGEPRAKLKKAAPAPDKGDCIDCKLCVQVCPTGIDIRNGTQMECVNCTACIDACDDVMDKINKPRGLIRFDSQQGVKEGKSFRFNGRMAAYTAVLTILVLAFASLLLTRQDISATLTKVRGTTYQQDDQGMVSNIYQLQTINKTFDPIQVRLEVDFPQAELLLIGEGEQLTIPVQTKKENTLMIKVPADQLKTVSTALVIRLYRGDEMIESIKTNFSGPMPGKKSEGKIE